jgi:hypothetical protein
MHESSQACAETGGIEIHEQTDWTPCQLEVCDHFREMNGVESFDRFHFDHKATFDQDVEPEIVADRLAAVRERDVPLALNMHALRFELNDEAAAINRLQQPWPEFPMHGDGAPDRPFRQGINVAGIIHAAANSTNCAVEILA